MLKKSLVCYNQDLVCYNQENNTKLTWTKPTTSYVHYKRESVVAKFFSFFLLLSSFDSMLVDIPCIISGIRSFFFPLTHTLDLLAAALHVHKCTKAHLDFDPQLRSVIVYVHQNFFYHCNNPVEIFQGT